MLLKCIGQDISLNVILDEENLVDTNMYNHTTNVSFKNTKFTLIPGYAPICLITRVGCWMYTFVFNFRMYYDYMNRLYV